MDDNIKRIIGGITAAKDLMNELVPKEQYEELSKMSMLNPEHRKILEEANEVSGLDNLKQMRFNLEKLTKKTSTNAG